MNPENGTPPSGEAYLSSSFIRDAWYVAAWDHEVGSSGVLARTLLGEPLVFYRDTQGQVVDMVTPWCEVNGKYVGRVAGEVRRSWGKVDPGEQFMVGPSSTPTAPWPGYAQPLDPPVRLPSFPASVLPLIIRRYVEAVAEFTQVDPAMSGAQIGRAHV